MYILKTYAICSECKPERAKKVAEQLQQMGWKIVYGGIGSGSVLPRDTAQFSKDFYVALDKVDYNV